MPTPIIPKSLAIVLSGGSVSSGVYVRATNSNTRDYQIKQTNSKGQVIFNLPDLSDDGTTTGTKTGVTTGDLIDYQVQGDAIGGGSYTVPATGQGKVTLTQTDRSTTNTPGVSI